VVWKYFKTNTSNAFIAKLALFGERPHSPFPQKTKKLIDKGKKLCYKESDLFRASEVDSNPSNPTS